MARAKIEKANEDPMYKKENAVPQPYGTGQTSYEGNDKLLFGIILGVLSFWLFAQTTLNINVDMAKDLDMETSMMNIAVSITSLFSGIFVVVMGGLADRIGRLKIIRIGFFFSIAGSLLVALTPAGSLATPVLISGRVLQGLSGACIMPASLILCIVRRIDSTEFWMALHLLCICY